MPLTCSKTYTDIPFAHRQHLHDGHCALIHGHNWAFEFTFAADRPDANGFVVDFGKLKGLKNWLERFDHALVLNEDDPHLSRLVGALSGSDVQFARVVIVDNCSCEGLAATLLDEAILHLPDEFIRRDGQITSVRVIEDSKNYATAYR